MYIEIKYFFIIEDFKARTSVYLDFITHDDNDVYIPIFYNYVADHVKDLEKSR